MHIAFRRFHPIFFSRRLWVGRREHAHQGRWGEGGGAHFWILEFQIFFSTSIFLNFSISFPVDSKSVQSAPKDSRRRTLCSLGQRFKHCHPQNSYPHSPLHSSTPSGSAKSLQRPVVPFPTLNIGSMSHCPHPLSGGVCAAPKFLFMLRLPGGPPSPHPAPCPPSLSSRPFRPSSLPQKQPQNVVWRQRGVEWMVTFGYKFSCCMRCNPAQVPAHLSHPLQARVCSPLLRCWLCGLTREGGDVFFVKLLNGVQNRLLRVKFERRFNSNLKRLIVFQCWFSYLPKPVPQLYSTRRV